tara:strand:- start:457 stop:1281 length:825 start_codon:yes stop_codon:yes gene_type:complete
MDNVMEIRPNLEVAPPPGRPPPPSCFDQDTMIIMKNGDKKAIKNIQVGEELEDGGKVTAVFKLSAHHQKMFNVDGVIVSGAHSIREDGKWVKVADYLSSKPILTEYQNLYLYNLNTTTKEIPINGKIFCDWDEITPEIEGKLWSSIGKVVCVDLVREDIRKYRHSKNKDKSFIHKYFDGGFDKNSLISMSKNRTKSISTVKIGDKLKNGGVVYGIVRIDKQGIIWSTSSESLEKTEDNEIVYHLLVNSNTHEFEVDGIPVLDYNDYLDSAVNTS